MKRLWIKIAEAFGLFCMVGAAAYHLKTYGPERYPTGNLILGFLLLVGTLFAQP